MSSSIHSNKAKTYIKYNPKNRFIKHIVSLKRPCTSLSSPIKPLIAKYKKPPLVKARHWFM